MYELPGSRSFRSRGHYELWRVMFRILVPKATIRICGDHPSIFGDRQAEILCSGINAIMTGDYLTTDGISPKSDFQMIRMSGFALA